MDTVRYGYSYMMDFSFIVSLYVSDLLNVALTIVREQVRVLYHEWTTRRRSNLDKDCCSIIQDLEEQRLLFVLYEYSYRIRGQA